MDQIANTTVSSPIGIYDFSVNIDNVNNNRNLTNLNLINSKYNPKLPKEMSVLECRLILLKLKTNQLFKRISFNCSFKGNTINKVGSNSGEGLECFEWETNNCIVSVGTEDLGYLLRRYPNETYFKNGNDPVSFYNNTISLSLEEIPSNSEISLHYLIAWNTLPEKISPSTWFSVDIDHKILLKAIGTI